MVWQGPALMGKNWKSWEGIWESGQGCYDGVAGDMYGVVQGPLVVLPMEHIESSDFHSEKEMRRK